MTSNHLKSFNNVTSQSVSNDKKETHRARCVIKYCVVIEEGPDDYEEGVSKKPTACFCVPKVPKSRSWDSRKG